MAQISIQGLCSSSSYIFLLSLLPIFAFASPSSPGCGLREISNEKYMGRYYVDVVETREQNQEHYIEQVQRQCGSKAQTFFQAAEKLKIYCPADCPRVSVNTGTFGLMLDGHIPPGKSGICEARSDSKLVSVSNRGFTPSLAASGFGEEVLAEFADLAAKTCGSECAVKNYSAFVSNDSIEIDISLWTYLAADVLLVVQCAEKEGDLKPQWYDASCFMSLPYLCYDEKTPAPLSPRPGEQGNRSLLTEQERSSEWNESTGETNIRHY